MKTILNIATRNFFFEDDDTMKFKRSFVVWLFGKRLKEKIWLAKD